MCNSPIIITGMHRSGTSLLSKLLIKNSFNFGYYRDINNESIYFQRLNRWIMSCRGSSWDNPLTFSDMNDEDLDIIVIRIKELINNRFPNSLYFGFPNILFNKSFSNISENWAWKDPANIFTNIIWKKIFPDLKIINIVRNPIDVSISLLRRQKELKSTDKYIFTNFLASFIPLLSVNKGGILSSFNLENIDDCLLLYKKYLNEMKSNNNIYKNNIINVHYEDLLENPMDELLKIYDFCNLKNHNIEVIVKNINSKNLNKYTHSNYSYNKSLLNDLIFDF